MMRRRFNSFGRHIRQLFGVSVYKTNVDAGFTCPNRDGTAGVGGCIYCNNDSFKPGACRPALSVTEQVRNGREYLGGRYGAEKFLAYFQAYTNTYAPVDRLRELYSEALAGPDVVGLAIGTRPDCVDAEKLALLEELARDHFVLVEYGVQSVYDETLKYINRGHDYATFLRAVDATLGRAIHVGAHLIMGFPNETRDMMLDMAHAISDSGVEYLKLHQLQVIRNTPLADEYGRSAFHVFGYEEYLEFLVDFIERLDERIVLQRLFATAPDEILVAPKWGRNRHEMLTDIDRAFDRRDTCQGRKKKIPVSAKGDT